MGAVNGNGVSGTVDSFASTPTRGTLSGPPAMPGFELKEITSGFYFYAKSAEHGQAQARPVFYLSEVSEKYYYEIFYVNFYTPNYSNTDFLKLVDVSITEREILLNSNTPANQQIDLTFNEDITLIGAASTPSSWVLTSVSGADVLVSNVQVVTNQTVRLTTTEFTNGQTYTLMIPDGIINRVYNLHFDNITTPSITFTAIGVSPEIEQVSSVNSNTFIVIFSEPVNESDALNINNYSCDNGLTILNSEKITSSIFKLTTSDQIPGTTYLLTASNIRDLKGNVI